MMKSEGTEARENSLPAAPREESKVSEERLKLAVFIDFDNIEIGVKETLRKEFDVSLVLEALKERGEVVTKIAYGDWHRAGEQSRSMTQHAVQLVQRNVTPRGDKNGADINLALDALEMAFNRSHINAFAIVGGDSDFIALVEKLKAYDKRVIVVGGRAFTSNILQRNCHEFIAYENLLKSGDGGRAARSSRARERSGGDSRPLNTALPNLQRALKILSEREVSPQIGLFKSTLLQLDPTFSERDYGAGSFLEFVQKMAQAGLVRLRRVNNTYLVDSIEGVPEEPPTVPAEVDAAAAEPVETPAAEAAVNPVRRAEAFALLKQALAAASAKAPHRPLYMRHVLQGLRSVEKDFDEKQYGFRRVLDLLHEAQKDGLLRLQRDRKGALRIFPAASDTEQVSARDEEPAVPESESQPSEIGTQAEEVAAPLEVVESIQAGADELAPPAEEPTEVPARRQRKPRPARGTSKRGIRRASSRRKSEPPEEAQ
jgi:uncharacterized protein (TIGR00288 family)